MSLRNILDESVIKLNLSSSDKEECFAELVDVLVRAGRVADHKIALKAILDREAEGTTGIGHGCAVPHGKHSSIKKLAVALGVSEQGIEFDAVDGLPVRVVFLVLANANEPGPHLQALAEVSRVLRVPGFYRKLCEVSSAAEVIRLLETET